MKNFKLKHIFSIEITLIFVSFFFIFPNALGRLIESIRDFGISCGYYFCEMFSIEHNIYPTINNYPEYPFFKHPFFKNWQSPVSTLPESFEKFKILWSEYWKTWATWGNFKNYFVWLGDTLYDISYIIILLLPVVICFIILIKKFIYHKNNDYGKDSKPLVFYKLLSDKFFKPIKLSIISYFNFLKTHSFYWKIWLILWLFYLNFLTIIIEFVAFYLYFAISYDLLSIYKQVYKLLFDLWTIIYIIPGWLWIVIVIGVIDIIAYKVGLNTLYHRERMNRGFINERGVVSIVYGVMGAGKTAMITDMSLSAEVELRDMAYEIILESDMQFPNFPWAVFEQDIKKAIRSHIIYDVWSCKRYIENHKKIFENCDISSLNKCLKRHKKNPVPYSNLIFGYDFERYGLKYDNKLELVDIWSVLENYAKAYFIYTIQSSLIVSNYSIRVDSLMSDIGNFPIWNCDFFKRDSRLIDSHSRHSHILDFDMLRLGKTMLKENPNRNAFGFGVYIVSELDKERKNTLELKEVKSTSDECNQKNDMFNAILKMCRHATVISNRIFLKIFADLQRPESLGADARELGEIVFISKQTSSELSLPFYSPFWFFEFIFLLLNKGFKNVYSQYRYMRSDNTLFIHLYKSFISILQKHYDRVYNMFGSTTLMLDVESGRMDGEVLNRKYYRQSKKIWAKRYSTDCLSGIFEERSKFNKISIADLKEYSTLMATNDELQMQNSYFQNDIKKYKE